MHDLTTEQTNPNSVDIDELSTHEIVQIMNSEDQKVAVAVRLESNSIARAIDAITEKLRAGGRLIYLGAGTSGRLGVLDASECPPTFNTRPEMVVGLIAGGYKALTSAIEGAEDNAPAAVDDLKAIHLSSLDVVVGIATSGRTPYVIRGLEYAKSLGAIAIGITCNGNSELHTTADIVIAPVVGPEIISGSTRLKAGTATKMVLNMLTTGSMIKLGKTFGNWMVDLRATNVKLKARSIRIVSSITGLDDVSAAKQLELCNGEVKTTIVSHIKRIAPEQARTLLANANGKLRAALKSKA